MPPDLEAPPSPRSTSRRTSSRSTRTQPAMSQLSSSPHPLPPTSNLTPAGTTTVDGQPDASRTPPRRRLLPRPPRSVRRGRRHVLARGALPGSHAPSDGTPWRPAGHLRASAPGAPRIGTTRTQGGQTEAAVLGADAGDPRVARRRYARALSSFGPRSRALGSPASGLAAACWNQGVDGISFTVHPMGNRGPSDAHPGPIRMVVNRTELSPAPPRQVSGAASPNSGELLVSL